MIFLVIFNGDLVWYCYLTKSRQLLMWIISVVDALFPDVFWVHNTHIHRFICQLLRHQIVRIQWVHRAAPPQKCHLLRVLFYCLFNFFLIIEKNQMGLLFKLNWTGLLLELRFEATLPTLTIYPSLNDRWVLVCVQLNWVVSQFGLSGHLPLHGRGLFWDTDHHFMAWQQGLVLNVEEFTGRGGCRILWPASSIFRI